MNNLSTANIPPAQAYGRLLFLGLLSIVMASSILLGPLTAFPLSMAILLYGRKVGISLGVVCSLIVFGFFILMSGKNGTGPMIFGTYIFSLLSAVFVTNIFRKDQNPIQGLLQIGSLLVIGVSAFLVFVIQVMEMPVAELVYESAQIFSEQLFAQKEQIMGKGSIEDQQFLHFLSKPHLVAKEIMTLLPTTPGMLFIGVFFVLWLTIYMLLKSNSAYKFLGNYSYTEQDFLAFKMPELAIIPVIIIMATLALLEQESAPQFFIVAQNLLKCFGVFYFFQGFGIYIAFLDFLKISGIIRNFLIMFTILTGSWVLAGVGLFDMWVNFRKLFKRKQNTDDDS
jgi:hypothetical protein